jgi:hypothetical protein
MSSGFWDLFVQHVKADPHRPVSGEMNRLAGETATLLASLDALSAAKSLYSFAERVAERYDELRRNDPSDAGAPPGAPKPVPVPAEVLAAALRDFDEAEVTQGIREIRGGGGRKLVEFLPELQQAASGDTSRS